MIDGQRAQPAGRILVKGRVAEIDITRKYAAEASKRRAAELQCEQLRKENERLRNEHANSFAMSKELINKLEAIRAEWQASLAQLREEREKYKKLNSIARDMTAELKRKLKKLDV